MAKSVIVKRKKKYEDGEFGQIKRSGAYDAMRELGKEGLCLYIYLVLNNRDGFKYTLSPTAIKNALGISESQAKNISSRGYAQLMEKGFLKQENEVVYFLADGLEKVSL